VSVIFLVLPLALAIVLVAVVAFVWAARRGQYDDLDTPAMRAIFDDETQRRR
jgi:cbb3-type cytochrome oxidase maturation protein